MTRTDETFIRRALELARRGLGQVEPNPMVGAVIVRDGQVLGEGWHGRFGGPHAEVEALSAAAAAGLSPRGATMYVTLEPCDHQGKTPPCTSAILAAGIGRVVVAMEDPDEQVGGRGLRRLGEAGVEVECGLCEAEARELLAPYVKLRTRKRPWVIGKWAQTTDGFVALPPRAGRWISGELSRQRVHELRAHCDGICVGSGTVLADDPLLTNRSGRGRQLTRVVLDSRLRTPPDSRLITTASAASPVLVATTTQALETRRVSVDRLSREGVELLALPTAAAGDGICFEALLDELGRRKWTRLLVEGGPAVLRTVISAGLADELWVFVSPQTVREPPANLPKLDIRELQQAMSLPEPNRVNLGPDVLMTFRLG